MEDICAGRGLLSLMSGCQSLSTLLLMRCMQVKSMEWLELVGRKDRLRNLSIKYCKFVAEADLAKFGEGWKRLHEFCYEVDPAQRYMEVFVIKPSQLQEPFSGELRSLSLSNCAATPGQGLVQVPHSFTPSMVTCNIREAFLAPNLKKIIWHTKSNIMFIPDVQYVYVDNLIFRCWCNRRGSSGCTSTCAAECATKSSRVWNAYSSGPSRCTSPPILTRVQCKWRQQLWLMPALESSPSDVWSWRKPPSLLWKEPFRCMLRCLWPASLPWCSGACLCEFSLWTVFTPSLIPACRQAPLTPIPRLSQFFLHLHSGINLLLLNLHPSQLFLHLHSGN